jgi:predicted ATP-binding protein involved in virulence
MINRAPFERLELNFDNDNITILSGINGAGKTTLLSYIADSWYELARTAYQNEFEGKENKFYRLSSDMYMLDYNKPSIVYLRYIQNDGTFTDYIDIRGKCSETQYNESVPVDRKIPFSQIISAIEERSLVKKWGLSDGKTIENIFSTTLITYFPSYRYETPAYLNDPYKVSLKFKMNLDLYGYLPNPIEVTSDLPQIANWIMDIVLDGLVYDKSTDTLRNNLNELLTNILSSKVKKQVRLGISKRNAGMNRISIMDATIGGPQIYPSIFNMSSGELALLCLFGELIKQSDKISTQPLDTSGIVLIDEIDKHLHIKLQKVILPKLIMMFPNVQFVVSSHSPFLSLGLVDEALSYKIIDLDNGGIECCPQDNELFSEVYNMMIHQNEQFANLYIDLKNRTKEDNKPLIITEGKTDWKHIKAAQKALSISDIDIEYYEYEDTLGDLNLLQLLKDYARIPLKRIIIGIFDRDNFSKLNFDSLKTEQYVSMGNNVYMFAIPLVHQDFYGEEISIEHYYLKEHLLKENCEGRRLFLGSEFNEKGRDREGKYITRFKGIDHKTKNNGIVDDRVFALNDADEANSLAMSKSDFAELILVESEYAKDFDFTKFQEIFNVIKEIIHSVTE